MTGPAAYTLSAGATLEELVAHHAPLVKRIAHHLRARLPDSVQVDDLIQAGMIGLLDAARHYDARQGASFETYAGIRIRGAMFDEIRRNDWAPRSVHRKARAAAEAIQTLCARLGRNPEDHEVAYAMGITLAAYHQILTDSNSAKVLSLNPDTDADDSGGVAATYATVDDPFSDTQTEDIRRALAAAIAALPERERLLMSLYYHDELNLKEIGDVLGVSESRVSQLHGQAVARLQAKLRHWTER